VHQAGATARDLAAHHGIAHITVLGLLKRHVTTRRQHECHVTVLVAVPAKDVDFALGIGSSLPDLGVGVFD
jgi:hypothetical protein